MTEKTKIFNFLEGDGSCFISSLEQEEGTITMNEKLHILKMLIFNNEGELIKKAIDKGLLPYNMLFKAVKYNIDKGNYSEDNCIHLFSVLKKSDHQTVVCDNINGLIMSNNIKTIKMIDEDVLIKKIKNKEIELELISFIKCTDDTLMKLLPIYREIEFSSEQLLKGIDKLSLIGEKAVVLMVNLKIPLKPELEQRVNKQNKFCEIYFRNKWLKEKLEGNMTEAIRIKPMKI